MEMQLNGDNKLTLNQEKIATLNLVRSRLLEMKKQAELGIRDAQMEANSHVGAMQSRYDTFKEEAQSLVAAHQIRLIKLEDDIAICDALIKKLSDHGFGFDVVEMGAFLTIVSEIQGVEQTQNYFLVPEGSGMTASLDGINVICVTPHAPVVKPLLGLRSGDEADFISAGLETIVTVLKVY